MKKEINSIDEFQDLLVYPASGHDLQIDLDNYIINCEINMDENYQFITFDNCIFKKDFSFSRTVKNTTYFHKCEFHKSFNLKNALFEGNARILECKFQKVNFRNTKFNNLADFWKSTFNEIVIFYKTDFVGTTVFSSTTFKKNVLFTYSLINKVLILRGANIEQGIDISLAIIPGYLSLFDLSVKDFNSEIVINSDEDYEKCVSTEGKIPLKNKRETFRIFKKYHLDNKNPVEYQDYAYLENRAIRKELYLKLKEAEGVKTQDINLKNKWDRLRKWVRNILNIILLQLNRFSNNHGISYGRGILFTAFIGWIFFYLSLISTSNIEASLTGWTWEFFCKSFEYYIISLTPTHSYNYLEEQRPETMFYIFDFAGRIFVSYGIYQTIQAFRKYK